MIMQAPNGVTPKPWTGRQELCPALRLTVRGQGMAIAAKRCYQGCKAQALI